MTSTITGRPTPTLSSSESVLSTTPPISTVRCRGECTTNVDPSRLGILDRYVQIYAFRGHPAHPSFRRRARHCQPDG